MGLACDNIKVSIIMTTYNHAGYVGQAIDSILAQETSFSWELLIGDDASADATAQIIQAYASKCRDRIIPVIRKENIGASANFLDLLQRARGQYIATLEGDDIWTASDKLQKQVQYLDAHAQASACVHGVLLIDRTGKTLACQKLAWVRPRKRFRLKNFDGIRLPGHISSLLFRRDLLRGEAMDRLLRSHRQISDRTIFLGLLTKGEIFSFPQCMSAYRILRENADENLTKTIYLSQNNRFLDEMALFAKMSNWLWEEYRISRPFARAKCGVVLSALWGRNHVTGDVFGYVRKLLAISGSPGRIVCCMPLVTMQKFVLRWMKTQQ